MSTRLKLDRCKVRVIDTTPVPVVRLSRAKRRRLFTNRQEAAIGYCAAQKTYYCGVKLTLVVNENGVPRTHDLQPANRSDLRCLESMMSARQPLSRVILVGDKGYISEPTKRWLQESWRVTLITGYRKNQRRRNTRGEKRLLKKRRIIETIVSQLKDQMGLERLRAKTCQGLTARIDNLLFTYLFGVYFNTMTKRNPLNLKSILT